MSKRYYCDYCDKTMVAAPLIIRTHNKGLIHQKLVQEHYQRFKDPETILAEENTKKPCLRFTKGDCQFGSICRYSHYTREEMSALNNYVAAKNQINANAQPSFEDLYLKLQNEKSRPLKTDDGNTIVYDNNGVTHILPWAYNPIFDSYGNTLPPSLRRLNTSDFNDVEFIEWG